MLGMVSREITPLLPVADLDSGAYLPNLILDSLLSNILESSCFFGCVQGNARRLTGQSLSMREIAATFRGARSPKTTRTAPCWTSPPPSSSSEASEHCLLQARSFPRANSACSLAECRPQPCVRVHNMQQMDWHGICFSLCGDAPLVALAAFTGLRMMSEESW